MNLVISSSEISPKNEINVDVNFWLAAFIIPSNVLWPKGGNDTKAAGMVDGAREEWSGVDGNMATV